MSCRKEPPGSFFISGSRAATEAPMNEANLTRRIFLALLLGAATGLFSHHVLPPDATGALAVTWNGWMLGGVIAVIAGLFMALLKMLVVPLVFVSLVNGVAASSADMHALGRLGARTFALYLAT